MIKSKVTIAKEFQYHNGVLVELIPRPQLSNLTNSVNRAHVNTIKHSANEPVNKSDKRSAITVGAIDSLSQATRGIQLQ